MTIAPDRTLFEISGSDRIDFLQGLVTSDVTKQGLIYTALLTPQGKFIADFFLLERGDMILLDVKTSHAAHLLQRLTLYKLRADVVIAQSTLVVSRGIESPPNDAETDPRHTTLGWRWYGDATGAPVSTPEPDWDALRVAHIIPETGVELTPDTYILEAGFERLNGVDFKKGCFVGQEIVARMKHKTDLRKGLVQLRIDGGTAVGTVITSNEKPSGTLFTQSGGLALAHMRFDRMTGELRAEGAKCLASEA